MKTAYFKKDSAVNAIVWIVGFSFTDKAWGERDIEQVLKIAYFKKGSAVNAIVWIVGFSFTDKAWGERGLSISQRTKNIKVIYDRRPTD